SPAQTALSASSLESTATGGVLLMSVMSSVSDEHDPFDIVQRNTVPGPPAVTPVTLVVNELALLIVPGPEILVHVPVPTTGSTAVTVNVLLSHCSISTAPASAGLGVSSNRIVTSSSVEPHALVIV